MSNIAMVLFNSRNERLKAEILTHSLATLQKNRRTSASQDLAPSPSPSEIQNVEYILIIHSHKDLKVQDVNNYR